MRLVGFQRAAFARMGGSTSGGAPSSGTFIVQTPDASLPSAQALSVLASGLLYNTTATGVLQTAALGSGLSGTTTITNDVLTGKAGGQTWAGGVAASEALIIQSTTHATKGTITLTASQVLNPNGSVSAPGISFASHPGVGITNISGSLYFSAGANYWFVVTAGGDIQTTNGARYQYGANNFMVSDHTDGAPAVRNGTTAQTLRVYNTYTSSTVYERGVFDWNVSANVLTIGAQQAGAGTLRGVSHVGASHSFDTQLRAAVGTVAAPSYSFTGFTGYGMWGDTGNSRLAWSVAGIAALYMSAGILTVAANAATIDFGPASDPRFKRNGATGVLEVSATHGMQLLPGGVAEGNTSMNYVDVAPLSTPSAGGATITSLYTFRVRAQTYANSGASNTLSSSASTVYIDGPPVFTGTWATGYTNTSLRVASGSSLFQGTVSIDDGTTPLARFEPSGNAYVYFGEQLGINTFFSVVPPAITIASSDLAFLDRAMFGALAPGAITITGTTPITRSTGFNYFAVYAPVFSNATAGIIVHAATMYLNGPPTITGGGTITNVYTLWIDSGLLRYDGHIANGGGGTPTFANSVGGSGPAATNQVGWGKYISDGQTYFFPTWQ